MVQGTFVLSAHVPKTEKQKQRVNVRSTRFRYAIVVLAIAVVFFYEYCYDNPSVLSIRFRPSKKTLKQIIIISTMKNWEAPLSTYSTRSIVSPMSLFPSSEALSSIGLEPG
jgi:amino acid transporter